MRHILKIKFLLEGENVFKRTIRNHFVNFLKTYLPGVGRQNFSYEFKKITNEVYGNTTK